MNPLKAGTRALNRQVAAQRRAAGEELEQRTKVLFQNLGYWNVQTDLKLYDPNGNLSQIDVRYGVFRPGYVECKNYSKSSVGLEDVAKFKEVLQLNNIPVSRGVFVTTSRYVPRATTIGVRCIDGAELEALEAKAFRRRRRLWVASALAVVLVSGLGVGLLSGQWQKEAEDTRSWLSREHGRWVRDGGDWEARVKRAGEGIWAELLFRRVQLEEMPAHARALWGQERLRERVELEATNAKETGAYALHSAKVAVYQHLEETAAALSEQEEEEQEQAPEDS